MTKNETNIARAAQVVRRQPKEEGWALVHGYAAIRFKAGDAWLRSPPQRGLRIFDGRRSADVLQTIVFIAFEDWGPNNGFFMKLKAGDSIFLDSLAPIVFPPAGGGIGIFFAIKL